MFGSGPLHNVSRNFLNHIVVVFSIPECIVQTNIFRNMQNPYNGSLTHEVGYSGRNSQGKLLTLHLSIKISKFNTAFPEALLRLFFPSRAKWHKDDDATHTPTLLYFTCFTCGESIWSLENDSGSL